MTLLLYKHEHKNGYELVKLYWYNNKKEGANQQ